MNNQFLAIAAALCIAFGCTNNSADPSHLLAEMAYTELEKDFGIVDAQIIDVLQVGDSYEEYAPLQQIGQNKFVIYEESKIGKRVTATYLKGSPPFYHNGMVILILQARDKDEVYAYSAVTWDKSKIIEDGREYSTGLVADSITASGVFKDFPKMPRNSADGLRYWRKQKRDILESGWWTVVEFYDFSWLDLKEW